MPKTKIALLYGGRSVEHGVSINSARNIFEYIDKDRFEPYLIGITTKGQWFLTTHVTKDIESGKALSIQLNPQAPAFSTGDGTTFTVDLVFPVLHGTDGEDGSIQGMLKALDLPLIGTSVLGSATSIHKLAAKRLLKEAGLPVADFLYTHYADRASFTFDAIEKALGLPFMIKAASLGSSVGVSKVKSRADFDKALEDSFQYDDCVLAERYIKGREIECAVMGNTPAQTSLAGEIIISSAYEFYTFDAKYVDSEAVAIEVPAKLDNAVMEQIRTLSVKAFQALNCEDFARVDLFLTPDNKVYVNEINTIPGFTNSSMFPMMWKERGISFTELISRLAALALERFEKSKRIARDFESALKY